MATRFYIGVHFAWHNAATFVQVKFWPWVGLDTLHAISKTAPIIIQRPASWGILYRRSRPRILVNGARRRPNL